MAALLTAGSGVDDTNARGKTPLMYAAEIGLAEPVMLLLDARAAVNRVANDGFNALHHAVCGMDWHGHDSTAALESLLDAGAHVRERDGDGNTAYRTAAQVNSAQQLFQPGRRPQGSMVMVRVRVRVGVTHVRVFLNQSSVDKTQLQIVSTVCED